MKKFAIIFLSFMCFSFSLYANPMNDVPNLTQITNMRTYNKPGQLPKLKKVYVSKINLSTPNIGMKQGAEDIKTIVSTINKILDPTPLINASKQLIQENDGHVSELLMTPNEVNEINRIEQKALKGEKLTSKELYDYANSKGLKKELEQQISERRSLKIKDNVKSTIRNLFK